MKFLIAGFGSIGRRHFRNLQELGHKEIVLLRSGRSTLPTEELQDFSVEQDMDAALAHRPDGMIIATPTASHLDLAIPAAAAGVHLLIEKPISHSLERVRELEAAAKKGGSKILIGFQYRFHPGLIQMKAAINSGAIGKPIQARVHWGEYLPDWHPWEDYKQSYSAQGDLGGGVTLTLSHPFDYLHWLIGKVKTVSTMVGENRVLDIEVDEQSQSLLRFKNGALASVQLDYLQRPAAHWIEIQCEQGYLVCDFQTNYFKMFNNVEGKLKEFPPDKNFDRNNLFLSQTGHFIDVIEGIAEPNCTLEDGTHALEIALAALNSAEQKKLVNLAN
jgi:predicted dehydrogenase